MRPPRNANAPIIQMRRGGTATLASADTIEKARVEYQRLCWVRLPQLLEPELWQFVQRKLSKALFDKQSYKGIGSELSMVPGTVDSLLTLMANDADFLQIIRRITSCDTIRSFVGRVYRLMPGEGHETNWHNDLTGTRLAAMTVNLSPEVYVGGTLQLRDAESHQLLGEVINTGPADAILFRIGSDLQHRVTPVNGAVPKSAFAGWFQSEPVVKSAREEVANRPREEDRQGR